jgi:uncharacterized membrane protein YdjX (TVP38/TMEM64 family)
MRLALLFFAVVLLMIVPVLIFGDEIDDYFSGEEGLRRLQDYGDCAWLVGIGLLVADLLLPVPSTAIITGLGMLYGPWLGGIIGSAGSLLAGLVAYGGCRLLGQRFVRFLLGTTNLEKLATFFTRYGPWAIALSRWLPVLPEALCCLAGMARMRLVPFVAALACGSLSLGMTFAFLGAAYHDRPVVGMLVSALIALATWPVVYALLRRPGSRTKSALTPGEE